MKKYFILTSVLALAACGGGSGGNSGIINTVAPAPIETPIDEAVRVSKDSGLSMIDINATREKKYKDALATTDAIMDALAVTNDAGVTPARTATLIRTAAQDSRKSDTAQYSFTDITGGYNTMLAILKDGNTQSATDRDIIFALALSGMDKDTILHLFAENENNFAAAISWLKDLLAGDIDDRPDEIVTAVKEANSIYADFGKAFDVKLDNAKFEGTITNGYFTFVLDNETNKVIELKQIDGDAETFTAVGNGKFVHESKGMGYYTSVDTGDHQHFTDVGTLVTADASDDEILNNLANVAVMDTNGDFDTIRAELAEKSFINYDETCTNPNGCITRAPSNATDIIAVESRGKDLGLKYSDFGLTIDTGIMHPGHVLVEDDEISVITDKDLTYWEHSVFAGGYEDKKADTPQTDATFTGLAYAGVTVKRNDWDLETYQEPKLAQYDGTATLTVTHGDTGVNQKLVAEFPKWYTVTVDDMGHMNKNAIHFTGESENPTFAKTTNDEGDFENLGIKYYGPDVNTPTEVVGYIQYVERDEDGKHHGSDWHFKTDISFGATRQ